MRPARESARRGTANTFFCGHADVLCSVFEDRELVMGDFLLE